MIEDLSGIDSSGDYCDNRHIDFGFKKDAFRDLLL